SFGIDSPGKPQMPTPASAATTYLPTRRKPRPGAYGAVLRPSSGNAGSFTGRRGLARRDGSEQIGRQRQRFAVQAGGDQIARQSRPAEPARGITGGQPHAGSMTQWAHGRQAAG